MRRLYELFAGVSFDDLVPTLRQICESEPRKITGQLPHFKMAFDELRMIAPVINDGTIGVDSAESFVCVDGCQDHWDIVLGKTIRMEPGLTLPENELAAHILWEITFFGYSEEEMMESIGREYGEAFPLDDNIYRRRIRDIEERQWQNYSRGAQWEIQQGRKVITADVLMKTLDRQKRRNRPKRMRDARQRRQVARLEKLARKEEIICNAVASGCVSRDEMEYILTTSAGEEHIYHSRTPSTEGRAEYLIELLSKYDGIDFAAYDRAAVIVTYSPDYPLTSADRICIEKYFSEVNTLNEFIVRSGADSSLTTHHLKMLVVVSD